MTVQDTLDEREKQYGPFTKHCSIEASLMNIVNSAQIERDITDVQQVGLHMIIHKISRILNGGYDDPDCWHDIAGYATLVEQDMTKNKVEINTNG